jgi:predicted DNA-binding protein YlxM (UPF0122 family)
MLDITSLLGYNDEAVKQNDLRGVPMADVEERYELNVLLDFYGPLLTEHRREVVRLYCEEDLSLQEIADQLAITRQGVFDAIAKARKQLSGYEAKLGLAARHRAQTDGIERCLEALGRVRPEAGSAGALADARRMLEDVLRDADSADTTT